MSTKPTLFDAARASASIIRARWAGDHDGAALALSDMSPAEVLDAVWSMSGFVEFALRAPSATPPDVFLEAVLEGIDNSETEQMGDTK